MFFFSFQILPCHLGLNFIKIQSSTQDKLPSTNVTAECTATGLSRAPHCLPSCLPSTSQGKCRQNQRWIQIIITSPWLSAHMGTHKQVYMHIHTAIHDPHQGVSAGAAQLSYWTLSPLAEQPPLQNLSLRPRPHPHRFPKGPIEEVENCWGSRLNLSSLAWQIRTSTIWLLPTHFFLCFYVLIIPSYLEFPTSTVLFLQLHTFTLAALSI